MNRIAPSAHEIEKNSKYHVFVAKWAISCAHLHVWICEK